MGKASKTKEAPKSKQKEDDENEVLLQNRTVFTGRIKKVVHKRMI